MSRVTKMSQAVQAFVLGSSLLIAPIICEANTATLRSDELFQPAQWRDTHQRQEVYDGDIVILSDGQKLTGRLNKVPSLDYSFGTVQFDPDEVASLSFGRIHGLPKMQVITRQGYNFIGDMPKEQLQFDEDVVDLNTGRYAYVRRSLDPYDINYVVLEAGQESLVGQDKFFHVSLKNGDEVSVLLGEEPIHLTDGWHDQNIPADSLSRVCFNGGLHGYYEGEEGDEALGFAFVKDSHLNMRLAKDRNLLRMPWTQIDSVRVDLGDFRPDMHQISWVNESQYRQPSEPAIVTEIEEPVSDLPFAQDNIPLSDKEEMMYIPAGSYIVMVEGNEPSAQVDMAAFYTDKRPVTNKQYAAFVAATEHEAPAHWVNGRIPQNAENDPVVNVSYQDAADYAAWLGRRLPNELEWQRAAAEANAIVAQTEAHRNALQNDQALSLLSFLTGIEPALAAETSSQIRFSRAHNDISGSMAEWTSSDAISKMTTKSRYADHKVVRTGFIGDTVEQHFPPRWRLHQNDRNLHTGFRTVLNAE